MLSQQANRFVSDVKVWRISMTGKHLKAEVKAGLAVARRGRPGARINHRAEFPPVLFPDVFAVIPAADQFARHAGFRFMDEDVYQPVAFGPVTIYLYYGLDGEVGVPEFAGI